MKIARRFVVVALVALAACGGDGSTVEERARNYATTVNSDPVMQDVVADAIVAACAGDTSTADVAGMAEAVAEVCP